MENIKSINSASLHEFIEYCKVVSDNANKLEEINNYLTENVGENKKLIIHCLAFENITSNGIPNEEIEFADSYYFDDLKDNMSEEFTYEEHENKHLLLYSFEKLAIDPQQIVDDKVKQREFINILLAYFYFTVVKMVDNDDEDRLASFIHSISINSIDNLNENYDDFIYDEIIDCLKYVFGKDIYDYKSDDESFTVTNYDGFTGSDISYNLPAIAREIINELI